MSVGSLDTSTASAVTRPGSARRRRAQSWRRSEPLIYGGGAVLALLIVWEIAWQAGAISPLFFSGPSAIVQRGYEMVLDGTLPRDIAYTGRNFIFGFALSLAIGVPLGIVLGWYRRLLLAFDPLISALYSTPRVSLFPLIIIWFGIGSGSKIFIVFLSGMLPILVSTIAGMRNLDPDLLKAARAFCAPDRKIFVSVALPASVPFILNGVRQAIAHGLIGAIVAELFAGNEGIGYRMAYAGQLFQTDTLLVGVVVTAAAGMALTSLSERLQRRFQRWRPDHVGKQ